MKIESFLSDPLSSFIYAERYVNNGSPSGFSTFESLPKDYNPRTGKDYFLMPLLPCMSLEIIGEVPEYLRIGMPAHPSFNEYPGTIKVAPTSSGRTVISLKDGLCFKLHYPSKIGRAPRTIGRKEIDRALYTTSLLGRVKLRFGYLPECGGWYSEELNFGAILRRVFQNQESTNPVIPGFAFFSKDIKRGEDPTLLEQLLEKENNYGFLLKALVHFAADSFHNRLLFEAHAQNVLFELNQDLNIERVLIRDFGDCYLDSEDSRGMNLRKLDSEEKKRFRSLLYDIKFGEYLLSGIEKIVGPKFRKDYLDMFNSELKLLNEYERFKESLPISEMYNYPRSPEIRINGKPNLIKLQGLPRFR